MAGAMCGMPERGAEVSGEMSGGGRWQVLCFTIYLVKGAFWAPCMDCDTALHSKTLLQQPAVALVALDNKSFLQIFRL